MDHIISTVPRKYVQSWPKGDWEYDREAPQKKKKFYSRKERKKTDNSYSVERKQLLQYFVVFQSLQILRMENHLIHITVFTESPRKLNQIIKNFQVPLSVMTD